MTFTWIDYALVIIILLSTMMGFFRGLLLELVSLIIWVLAFLLAFHYATGLSDSFQNHIQSSALRLTLAFVLILLATLLLGSVIKFIASQFGQLRDVNVTNRILGATFGVIRGIFLCVILLLVGELAAYNQTMVWQHSWIIPHLQFLVGWLQHFIPADAMQYTNLSHPVAPVNAPGSQ
jgi:membrane protein required for colicin V production